MYTGQPANNIGPLRQSPGDGKMNVLNKKKEFCTQKILNY